MIPKFYIFLICYVPILHVFLPKTNFGAGLPDIDIVRITICFIYFGIMIELFLRKSIKLSSFWTNIIGIFSLYAIISIFWSTYKVNLSLLSNIFDTILMPYIVVIIAMNLFKEYQNIELYFKNLIYASLVLSIISVFQFVAAGTSEIGDSFNIRSAATLGNPNLLALFIVFSLPCLLYSVERKKIKPTYGLLMLITLSAGVLCTISRKGIFSFILIFFIYSLLTKQYFRIILFSIFIFLSGIFLVDDTNISTRFSVTNVSKSIERKKEFIAAGIEMFQMNPFFGLGYNGYYERSDEFSFDGKKWSPHNIYINALTNYGVVGFVPFLTIFVYPLYIALKNLLSTNRLTELNKFKHLTLVSLSTLCAFIISGYFAGGLFTQPVIMYIFYSHIETMLSRHQFTESLEENVSYN